MKKIKLIRLVVLILLLSIAVPDFAPLAAGSTVTRTYTAIADTMELNGQAEYNGIYDHDGDGYLYVGMSNNDGFVNVRNRMATSFNLGAPEGTIVSAELVLTVATTLRVPNHTLYMEARGSSANSLDHNFNGTFPSIDMSSPYTDKFTAKSTAEVPMGTYLQDQTITLNVKAAVDAFTDSNDRKITFIINGNESDVDSGKFLFYSLESLNPAFHPKLVVTYETEPVNTSPTGSFTIMEGTMTGSNTVNLSIEGSDSDAGDSVTHMRFAESVSNLSMASWSPFRNTAIFSLTGGDGPKTIYMQLKDSRDGISANFSQTIVLDRIGPSAPSITAPVNGSVIKNSRPTISGTAEAASTVTIFKDGILIGTVTTNGAGNWTFTTSILSEGSHSITATATDAAGNESVASIGVNVTIDITAPPAPSITTPTTGSIFNHGSVTISGTAEAFSTVRVFAGGSSFGTVTANGAGNWFITTSNLAEGSHSITATATDGAGNTSVASTGVNVTIDTTAPPTPSITTPTTGSIFNHGSVTISGTAEASSTVRVFAGGSSFGTATANGAGNWSITTSNLAEGSHSIMATATDGAGNTSAASPPINITIATNNSPTDLTLSSSIVEENKPANTIIGILSATDPDAGDTFTYSLVAGAGDTDNQSFAIIGNQLIASASFDYETQNSYSIRIQVTDNGGLSFYKQFTITITDVNENPIPTLVSMLPDDNEANASVNTNLSMTFSEAITPVAGKFITLYKSADSSVFETIDVNGPAVTINGSTVTISPAATFDLGTDYYVLIDTGAFKTAANQEFQGISLPTIWSFRTVEASTNANLSNLILSNGTLNTAFISSTTSYTASVSNSISSLTVTPTLADMNATVMVNGATVTSGNASGTIALAVGENIITVNVIAQDGTSKAYTVKVTRASLPSQPSPQPVVPNPVPLPPSNQISIQPVLENDGVVGYRGIITLENVQAILQQLTNKDERVIRVNFPAEATTVKATLEVQRATVELMAKQEVDLDIQLADALVRVPNTSFNGFTEDLFFRIVSLKPDAREAIEQNAQQNKHVQAHIGKQMTVHLFGQPVSIETNLQNQPVTITLPIPSDVTAEQLQALFVYIEHSNGTTEVKEGRIVDMANGKKGYAFEVDHFSTFSLMYATAVQPTPEPIPEADVLAPYIQGYPDGLFKPNLAVTRAQMATMIARFLTNGAIPTAEATFVDTQKNAAKDAIELVKQAGLFNGTSETTFNPHGTITRAQMAAVVARWVETTCAEEEKAYCTATNKDKSFIDVAANHWAAASIQKVSALGIMIGNSETTFNPNKALTRAQAVKVLNQLFERPALQNVTTSTFKDVPATHWAIGDIEAAATEIINKP